MHNGVNSNFQGLDFLALLCGFESAVNCANKKMTTFTNESITVERKKVTVYYDVRSTLLYKAKNRRPLTFSFTTRSSFVVIVPLKRGMAPVGFKYSPTSTDQPLSMAHNSKSSLVIKC